MTGFHGSGKNWKKMRRMNLKNHKNLKTIFSLMFKKLEEISIGDNFLKEIKERRERSFDKDKPDSYFYEVMVRDIHNAGMKATLVTSKLPFIRKAFSDFDIRKVSEFDDKNIQNLMDNLNIIRNEGKLRACVENAKKMKELSEQSDSFGEFLNQHKDNLMELRNRLTSNFRYLGNIVVLDYLKDIGIDIIKPDVHVIRVFFRLGFIDSEKQTGSNVSKIIEVTEQIKQETSEKLAVIDAIFWMYGGGGDRHVKKAICNKSEPLCSECPLINYCEFHSKNVPY